MARLVKPKQKRVITCRLLTPRNRSQMYYQAQLRLYLNTQEDRQGAEHASAIVNQWEFQSTGVSALELVRILTRNPTDSYSCDKLALSLGRSWIHRNLYGIAKAPGERYPHGRIRVEL
jgi:hypothetical protein